VGLSTGTSADPILRRPSGVQVEGRAVPTNDSYEMRVSYPPELLASSSPEGPVFSAADVLSGDLPDGALQDKVVFVGVTDVSLGDRLLTPVAKGSGLPGVLVHASAYDTMANRAYLQPASTLELAAWVFGMTLVIALAVQFLPASVAGVVAVATLVGYLVLAFLRVDTGIIMGFALPTLAVALAVPLSGGVRYLIETRQQRRVSALFSQYVPDRVAAQLIDEGSVERAAEGQRLDVTAMFCDLRGFTSRSADLLPVEVNTMLNDFYEFSCAIVLDHGGTLMTYIGDEIFVIFGAPLPQPDHARNAVACAKELQERCAELDDRLAAHGFESLRFGIGLNSGEIVATHAGSSWRRQYTAIGTAVNVAARLTAQSGPGQVVLSDAVRAQIDPPPPTEPLGHRDMKGVPDDFVAWKLVLDVTPSGAGDR
jgi:adenylate cyclase